MVLNSYRMEELLPIITISISSCIFLFALIRLTARYSTIANKNELFSLLWLSSTTAFWPASTLMLYDDYMAAVLLLTGFTCYTMTLLCYYTGKKIYARYLLSTFILLTLMAVGAYLFHDYIWWDYFFVGLIAIVYLLLTLFLNRYFLFGSGKYYKALSAVLTLAVILIIMNTIDVFWPGIIDLRFTEMGASLLVLAAGVNTLDKSNFAVMNNLNSELNRVREQYENETENMEDVVISLARTIDAKDKYTEGHIERVSQYATFLGERIGLDENTLDTIRIGALIHDIGKICVDLNILHKPSQLTKHELELIQQHPIMGEQICSPLKALREAGTIVRCHHEKLDGSGYPDGLSGESISLETRIVTIADIFDALTTERSYRKAMTVQEALIIMQQEAEEGKLDKALVDEFFSMLSEMEILA